MTIFLLLGCLSVHAADAVTGQVCKVLPFLLDAQGRDSTSPSLFDRDAYQAELRERTNGISGVRVDVLWRVPKASDEKLKLRVELRGVSQDGSPQLKNFEAPVTAGFFRHWAKFTLKGDDYKKFGTLVAWRATLWSDDRLLDEQKSFLW